MMGWAWGKRAVAVAAVAAAAAMVLSPASHARAGQIVNDTWLDGTDSDPAAPTYSEHGVDADADGNVESAWFQGGVGTLDPVGAGGPLRGNMTAGGASSASWTTYTTSEANQISLAQGETMRVTWQFSYSGHFVPMHVSDVVDRRDQALKDSGRSSSARSPVSVASAHFFSFGQRRDSSREENCGSLEKAS